MHELSPLRPEAPRLVPDEPLPPYRFLGDLHPHPRRDPAGHSHGAPAPPAGLAPGRWREDRSWLFGIDLYHQGYLWEAHERWEACLASPDATDAQRTLLRGLIQLAAALIQAHRGRGAGVRRLAAASLAKLRAAAAATPPGTRLCGLDVGLLAADVERHLAPALDPAASDAEAARTVGRAPRLDVGRTSAGRL